MQSAAKKHSQQKVLISIQKKDVVAFGILYDTYSQVIFGVINKIVPDTALAENILQQSFVKIWQGLSSFDASKQRLIAWMLVIARNAANDVIKNHRQADKLQIQTSDDNVIVSKEVLPLIYFKGYSLKLAAEAMNISIDELKARLKAELDQIRVDKIK